MVAQRQHVHPGLQEGPRHVGGEAEAVAGILRIHHDEVGGEFAPQRGQAGNQGIAPAAPHHVAQEQYSQAFSSEPSPQGGGSQWITPRSVATARSGRSPGPVGTRGTSCPA